MKKTLLYIFFFCLIQYTLKGQQDPQYSQYMYNMSIINPAYTTNDIGLLNLGTLYRSQWVSAVGGPKTMTFFAHAALTEKVEAGISFVSDNIGDGVVKENNVFADFAYNLRLDNKNSIALGLKAGITNFTTNFTNLLLPELQDDVAFRNDNNTIFPNIGIGAFYHREELYVGLSIPNLLSTKHLSDKDGVTRLGSEEMHVFLTAGYVYQLNPSLKLKPSILAKAVKGSPISFDAGLNVLLNEKFEAGVAYRLDDSVNAMFNIKVVPAIRIGYAYDYTLSNLGEFSSGSHEIFALFDLDLLGLQKGYDKSPRFY